MTPTPLAWYKGGLIIAAVPDPMVMGAGGSLADAAARGYPTTHRTAKAMAF